MKSNSINAHKEAKIILSDYVKKKSNYMFIHFARQNCFEDAYEKGPRIIAIVVMNAASEQTMAFSLKKSAEKYGSNFWGVNDSEKDIIEQDMLQSFFEYAKSNAEKTWLHWNMKNNNFGFSAIEERYKSLGGTPFPFEEGKLVNISVLLKKKYGHNFAQDCMYNGKSVGKMYDIFTLNKMQDVNILNGEQEVKEYILKNIMSIELSVVGKLKAFQKIMEKAADDDLKVRGSIAKDVYGLGIRGIAQYIQDNAILAIIFSILGGVVSTAICKLLGW